MATRTKPLRRDAARNREKLLAAASEVFAASGLDASLEEIARHAEVSIGTLYNHFPTRETLFDAIFPERVEAVDHIARRSLSHEDSWLGLTEFLTALFETIARDQGLRHVMTREYPDAQLLTEACHRGYENIAALLDRARESGQLRTDFTMPDLACLLWSMTRVIDATAAVAPQAWRRHLGFVLDGLRTDAAHRLPAEAMTSQQVSEALMRARR
ncbi:MAG: TetR/AcrR family transcriptional regulator [Stackebrandtia sp.]